MKQVTTAWASHYQQSHGQHPVPSRIAAGTTRIELMTEGRGWVAVGNDLQEVLPGDLMWHQENDLCICRSDFQNPYRCLSIIFHNTGDRDSSIPRLSTWADLNEVKNFTREILHGLHDDSFDQEALASYAYSRLFFQMKKYHHHGGGQTIPRQLRDVLEYIQEKYYHTISLPELAAHVSWSVPHLHDMCKRHLHSSPHKLIIRQRLLVAKEQLSSKHSSIQEVAAYCGFNSTTHFCRSFKQEIGRSPKQFKTEFLKLEILPHSQQRR